MDIIKTNINNAIDSLINMYVYAWVIQQCFDSHALVYSFVVIFIE